MTNPRLRLLVVVLSAPLLVGTGLALTRAGRAQAEAARQSARFEDLRSTAGRVLTLRAASTATSSSAPAGRPRSLAAAAAEVLATAGLPASILSSLSPESETKERADGGTDLRRRRATLTLTPLTLPHLGRVLEAWRQRLPEWTIARIDLEPRREEATMASNGGDLPLRAVLVIENLELTLPRRSP
jgi:hypothetical protein